MQKVLVMAATCSKMTLHVLSLKVISWLYKGSY